MHVYKRTENLNSIFLAIYTTRALSICYTNYSIYTSIKIYTLLQCCVCYTYSRARPLSLVHSLARLTKQNPNAKSDKTTLTLPARTHHTHRARICYYTQQTERAAHTTNFRLNAQSKIEINIHTLYEYEAQRKKNRGEFRISSNRNNIQQRNFIPFLFGWRWMGKARYISTKRNQ